MAEGVGRNALGEPGFHPARIGFWTFSDVIHDASSALHGKPSDTSLEVSQVLYTVRSERLREQLSTTYSSASAFPARSVRKYPGSLGES
jgi:hypothetical protein